jgi:hypothetical protein
MRGIGALRGQGGPRAAGGNTWKAVVTGGCLALAVTGSLIFVIDRHDVSTRVAAADGAPAANANQVMPTPESTAELIRRINDGDVTPEPPLDVTWELVNGEAVPVSLTAGPTKADGPVRYGFAHTPTGAALAAVNIAVRAAFTSGDGWLKVTQRQVAPSKGRDVFINARRNLMDLTPPEGGLAQLAGYRVLDYAPDRARVEIGDFFASGERQTYTSTVVWRDGDWQLELGPDGNPGPPPVKVASLVGFVELAAGMFP